MLEGPPEVLREMRVSSDVLTKSLQDRCRGVFDNAHMYLCMFRPGVCSPEAPNERACVALANSSSKDCYASDLAKLVRRPHKRNRKAKTVLGSICFKPGNCHGEQAPLLSDIDPLSAKNIWTEPHV